MIVEGDAVAVIALSGIMALSCVEVRRGVQPEYDSTVAHSRRMSRSVARSGLRTKVACRRSVAVVPWIRRKILSFQQVDYSTLTGTSVAERASAQSASTPLDESKDIS
jgi:hypothetical protein